MNRLAPARRHLLATGATALAAMAWRVARADRAGSGAGVARAAQDGARREPSSGGRLIRVGPGRDVATISAAAELAGDGDVVEIDAGEYRGDVAVWKQRRLSIHARGGPVQILADGRHAEGKGIWVIRDGDFEVSGIRFAGARGPHRNGSGIRFERGRLRLSDCQFTDNENGLLTGNDPDAELSVERCRFTENGAGDGYSHNLYVGSIGRCEVLASHFSRARGGQLLKCRAKRARVLYSRLTDELGGLASYELDFSNGGQVLVMGNLIVQQPSTKNGAIVTYGPEGYKWPVNQLFLVHNTIVNRRRAGGTFLRVYPGSVEAVVMNNLFAGRGALEGVTDDRRSGNAFVSDGEFRNPIEHDFRLGKRAWSRGTAVPPPQFGDASCVPTEQYRHPMDTEPIPPGTPLSPGAFQFAPP
jgi:hypothetical protein